MLLTLVEAAFALLFATGVGLIYLPAGMIVAGLLGVLACEAAASRRRPSEPEAGDEP